MENRRAHLRFDVVAHERQIFFFEALDPGGIARDENRDVIDEAEPGLEGTGGVKARGFFRADRQIIHHDLRAGVAQLFDDLFAGRFFLERKKGPLRIVVSHVSSVAVEDATHHDDGAGGPDFVAENFRAIRQRENGFGGIEPYFAAIDVEGGDDFDVLRYVRADSSVHQPDISAVAGRPSIKVDALEKRTDTVPDAHDGNSEFDHYKKTQASRCGTLGARKLSPYCHICGAQSRR